MAWPNGEDAELGKALGASTGEAWVLQENLFIRTVDHHRDVHIVVEEGRAFIVCHEVLRKNGRREFPNGWPAGKSSG